MPSQPLITSRQKPGLSLLQWSILGLTLLALYYSVLITWISDLWHDDNYSHGLLIPFLSLYFIRERMPAIKEAACRPYFPAAALVVLSLLFYILGYVGSEFFTQRISFILLLYSCIFFLSGKALEKQLRLPVLILFFAVPLPYILYNSVAFPLKLWASRLAVILIALTGRPVFADGNVIHLTHTTLEVVDACSGIRSLMTLFTLAFFLAYFFADCFWKRVLIFSLTLPITLTANALRVTATAVLTSYDPAWGEGFRHELTGWLVFVLSFVALAGVALLLRPKQKTKM